MLAMVVNERQNNWGTHLPHVEFSHNNSMSAATGLAPNEVHIGRLPRLAPAVLERQYGGGHQGLIHDQLAYCDLSTGYSTLSRYLVSHVGTRICLQL